MREEDALTGPDLSHAVWRKSSHSGGSGSTGEECVEVASAGRTHAGRIIAARDSKNPDGPTLLFTTPEWATFLDSIKAAAAHRRS